MTQTTNLIETQSLLSNYYSLKPGQNRTRTSDAYARDFSQLLRYKLGEPRRCGQGKKAAETPAKTVGKPKPRDESVNVKSFEPGLKKESAETAYLEPTSETKTSLDSGEKRPVEISPKKAVNQGERSVEPADSATTAEKSQMALLGQLLLDLSSAAVTVEGNEHPVTEVLAASGLPLTAGSSTPGVSETLLTWARILGLLQPANTEGGKTAEVDSQPGPVAITATVSAELLNEDTQSLLSGIRQMASAIPEEILQQLEEALTQLNFQKSPKTGAELPAMAAALTTADTSTVDKDLRRLLSQMIKVMQGSSAAAESDCTIKETAGHTSFDPLPQAVRLAESTREKNGLNQQSPVFSGEVEKPTEVLKTAADQEMENKDTQSTKVSEGKPLNPGGEGKTAAFDQGNVLFPKPVDENAALPVKNSADKTPAMFKQVAAGMRLIQREARTEMNIQLQPESLGKLNLKVAVENGLVTARLVAESQSVGRLIEGSLGQLKQSLHEQGLRFDRIEVAVGDSSVQPDLEQQFTRHQHSFTDSCNYSAFSTYPVEGEAQWEPYPAGSAVIERFGDSGQIDFLA